MTTERPVYFEFVRQGAYVQVFAIDGTTGVEVSVFGPAATPRADLERLALRKLQRRLEKDF